MPRKKKKHRAIDSRYQDGGGLLDKHDILQVKTRHLWKSGGGLRRAGHGSSGRTFLVKSTYPYDINNIYPDYVDFEYFGHQPSSDDGLFNLCLLP